MRYFEILESELPMDQKSRMARAKQMGFNTKAYHGTKSDFTEFSKEMANIFGAHGPVFYFTNLPDEASGYASDREGNTIQGSNVIPVLLRIKKPLVMEKRKDNLRDMMSEILQKQLVDLIGYNPDEAKRRGVKPKYDDWAKFNSERDKIIDLVYSAENKVKAWNEVYKNIMSQGYDAIIFTETATDHSEEHRYHNKIIMFNPRNIRSIFAKFDPAKSNSTNIND